MSRNPVRPVTTRKVNIRALSYALDGPEQPYPVYQFSEGRSFIERPRHNPFGPGGGVAPIPPVTPPGAGTSYVAVRLPWFVASGGFALGS